MCSSRIISGVHAQKPVSYTHLDVYKRQVYSLGIGIPGLIDWNRGICLLLPNFPNKWKHIPIKEWLEEKLSLPVAVINDVRAITLAEKRFGAGKNVKSLILMAIGTGIGGGVVIDGNLYIGKDGSCLLYTSRCV